MINYIHAWLDNKYQEAVILVRIYQDDIKSIKQKLRELSKPENHISSEKVRNFYSDQLIQKRKILKKHASLAKYLKQEIRKHSK